MSLIPAVFTDLITLTRASDAYRVNSSGILEVKTPGNPRFDYDPITLAAKGFLIEEASTNRVTQSETLDNAAWTKSGVTVTADATTSPTGVTNADAVVDTFATSSHYIESAALTFSSGYKYTISVYAKASGTDVIQLIMNNTLFGGTGTSFCNFNIFTGTVVRVGSNIESATIVPMPNGWYRCIMTSNTTTAGGSYAIQFALTNSADPTSPRPSYTGASSSTYFWGAQVERSDYVSSYIKTTTSQATRPAEVAVLNSSPWFLNNVGSVYLEFIPITAKTNAVLSLDNNTASEVVKMSLIGSDPYMTVVDGGTTQASIDAGTVSFNSVNKVAITFDTNSFNVCINGGAVVSDYSGTLPAITQMQLGKDSQATPTYLNGYLQVVRYYPRILSKSEMIDLTA